MSFPADLRTAGLRATPARIALLKTLQRAKQAMSIEAIYRKLQPQQIDRVTVYRATEALTKAGLLRNVDLGHSHAHYELNDPTQHHHHLICDACGRVTDVTVVGEDKILNRILQQHGFEPRDHSFEIFGRCAKCK